MSDIQTLRSILGTPRTVAVVGLSADWFRPSYFAAKYMQEHGFRVIPVNPKYTEILGEACYADLQSIPHSVDVVDVFRKPEDCVSIAQEAIDIGASVLWLQIGVINPQAQRLAQAAGLTVVMDRCIKIEYARLFGGLHWFGVNTGLISSRRPLSPPTRKEHG
jgi:predicted CoA-binding protein